MMYRYFFILMNCMCIFRAFAQTENTGVSGRVLEIEGTPVESATILLLQANDSSYVSGTVTDREGLYLFERVTWGDYLLKVMMLGYHPQYIPIHYTGKVPHELPVTYLKEDAILLSGVTVTANRYQVKLEPGKTTIQFSDWMTGTGGSVLEILRSLPGVLIQEDGSVMLNGQSGTKILVDGKETHL